MKRQPQTRRDHLLRLLMVLAVWGRVDSIAAQSETRDTAQALFEQGRYAEARAIFVAYAEREKFDAAAQYWAGRASLEEGRADRAREWLERAVSLDTRNSEYWLWLGRACGDQIRKAGVFRRYGLARETKRAFEAAVEANPDNLEARSNLIDYYLQAPRVVGGDPDEALSQAEEIRRRDEPWGLLEIARVHAWMERWDAAVSTLTAYEHGPPAQNRQALAAGAWARARVSESAGDRATALKLYEDALRFDPHNEAARDALRALR
jgi:tetratricopeptide (TPR) repeat protein